MQLRYYVPFKAQEDAKAEYALKQKLLNIEGVAVDTSVNANKWQIPPEDLDFLTQTLIGAQLRVDHAESALMIIGKVVEAKRDGDKVLFRAEVGEEKIIEKILRGYVNHVSVQVDSEDVECSKCKRPTRKEGMLIHLCPGAWEIVHKPTVRELSIVASPAYKTTDFHPVGFFAAMNNAQWDALVKSVTSSQSLEKSDDVGSNRQEVQEPEKQILNKQTEVEHMSAKADKDASPLQAQGVVNVAPEEKAPKPVEYEDLIKQLEKLLPTIKTGEEAKKLAKKLSEIAKRLLGQEAEEAEEAEETEEEEEAEEAVKRSEEAEEAKRASGRGIVAVDEMQKDVLSDYEWFKDLLKAHKKLVGFK